MPDSLRVRSATPADAEALAALAERTFRDTFADQNTPEDMDAYLRGNFTLRHVRDELADPANTFLLVFVGDAPAPSGGGAAAGTGAGSGTGALQPAGYAKLRTGEVHPAVTGPDPIELHRLYVDRGALGHGLGAALMRASLDAARTTGHRTLWLGVWDRNARAIAFYEKWGFTTVGEHEFLLGADRQNDFIMERAVSAQLPA